MGKQIFFLRFRRVIQILGSKKLTTWGIIPRGVKKMFCPRTLKNAKCSTLLEE